MRNAEMSGTATTNYSYDETIQVSFSVHLPNNFIELFLHHIKSNSSTNSVCIYIEPVIS